MSYLEVEDDGPDEPQGELGVAICDVIVADIHQFHLEIKATKGLKFFDRPQPESRGHHAVPKVTPGIPGT